MEKLDQKNYFAPEVEVIKFSPQLTILTGSVEMFGNSFSDVQESDYEW